jgi:hypothetical protein
MSSFAHILRRSRPLLAAVAASLTLGACAAADAIAGAGNDDDAGGGGGRVPSELVGRWYTGDVSSLTFYSQSTGSWSNAYGNGLSLTFRADGTFESGYLMSASSYGCTSKAFQFQQGTVRVDETARTYTVRITRGTAKGEDNCVARFNYERQVEPTTFTQSYLVRRGSDGKPELVVSADGGQLVLRAWNQ